MLTMLNVCLIQKVNALNNRRLLEKENIWLYYRYNNVCCRKMDIWDSKFFIPVRYIRHMKANVIEHTPTPYVYYGISQ